MAINIGEIVEGKVVKTTDFGAFIRIEEGVEGLVHISELSNDFVQKVEDIVKVGDEVKVKVVSEKEGKIALSMKQAAPKPPKPQRPQRTFRVEKFVEEEIDEKDMTFEDKLNRFLKQSNENLQQARTRENKRSNNKRKNNS